VVRRSRFWFFYALAWLPYAASYTIVFIAPGGNRLIPALADTLYNIVPAALLGAVVIRLCWRLPWSLHYRWWFFPIHLGFAILYASLWCVAVLLLGMGARLLEQGRLVFILFGGYALQWQLFSGLMIYGTLVSIGYVLQVARSLNEAENLQAQAETRAARAEASQTRAELEGLRAQLNPHFLFNTLNSLMALIRYDPAAAEEAFERFVALLRYTLEAKRNGQPLLGTDDTSLADEWQFAEHYLALEKLRLASRLQIKVDLEDDTLNCTLPSFTLQPLIENAIKHSISPRAHGGTISIVSHLEGANKLYLEISDDGPGAPPESLRKSTGLGMSVVQRRLETRYDGRAEFRVETSPGNGFRVMLGIPQDGIFPQSREEL